MSTSSSSAVSVIENRFKSFFLRVCIGLLYLFIAIELVDLLYVVIRGVTTFDASSARLLGNAKGCPAFAAGQSSGEMTLHPSKSPSLVSARRKCA